MIDYAQDTENMVRIDANWRQRLRVFFGRTKIWISITSDGNVLTQEQVRSPLDGIVLGCITAKWSFRFLISGQIPEIKCLTGVTVPVKGKWWNG